MGSCRFFRIPDKVRKSGNPDRNSNVIRVGNQTKLRDKTLIFKLKESTGRPSAYQIKLV